MRHSNNGKTLNSKTLGLALAAFLIPAGMASAHDGNRAPAIVKTNLSGHVEVVHQVPGGVITVGADWGKQRPAPQVVVVKEQPQVIIVEKDKKHHGHEYGRHRDREVTIIREQPRRQVTIIKREPERREVTVIKTVPARREVVVVEKQPDRNHYHNDGKQVSYDHNGKDGQYHYYKDANQVSETKVTSSGTYHYYEDANQVSIQDNRDGRQRNVYVRK